MTRVIICYLAVMALTLCGGAAWLYNDTKMTCAETLLGDALSPDGAWKATEYEQFCEGFLVTHITAVVRLASASDQDRSASLLVVSANTPDERPRFAWKAPLTLQVDVPSSLSLKVLTCEFEPPAPTSGCRCRIALRCIQATRGVAPSPDGRGRADDVIGTN